MSIPIRQVLPSITVISEHGLPVDLLEIIKDEVNVKVIKWISPAGITIVGDKKYL